MAEETKAPTPVPAPAPAPPAAPPTPAQAATTARLMDPQFAHAQAVADGPKNPTIGDPIPSGPGAMKASRNSRRAAVPEPPDPPQSSNLDAAAIAAAVVAAQTHLSQTKPYQGRPDLDRTRAGGVYVVEGKVVDAHGQVLTEDDFKDKEWDALDDDAQEIVTKQSRHR